MFRQDYRINNIFLPFQPPARRAYVSERRKAKSIIPLRGKAFNHCTNKTVKQGKKHPLLIPRPFFPVNRNCVFSALSGSREKKIKPIQLILSENILALCLDNYELSSHNNHDLKKIKGGHSTWLRNIKQRKLQT